MTVTAMTIKTSPEFGDVLEERKALGLSAWIVEEATPRPPHLIIGPEVRGVADDGVAGLAGSFFGEGARARTANPRQSRCTSRL